MVVFLAVASRGKEGNRGAKASSAVVLLDYM